MWLPLNYAYNYKCIPLSVFLFFSRKWDGKLIQEKKKKKRKEQPSKKPIFRKQSKKQ